jgi:hypothetical protein
MNKTLPIIGLCIATVALMAFNDPSAIAHKNAGGAVAGYSGDPAGGSLTCIVCHAGPPAMVVNGLITSDIPAEGYTPLTTYTITATIASAAHSRFGFEISPQNPDGDFLGTLVNTGTETLLNGAGLNYITHSFDGIAGDGSRTWTFGWTAPAQGTGSATFYGAFNATNSDFTQGGDTVYTSTLTVPEALTTGTAELGTNAVAVFPNPTTDRITIKTNSSVGALFMITDQAGRQVASGKLAQECTTVDLSGSAAGAYSLRIGDHVPRTLKVIKQ